MARRRGNNKLGAVLLELGDSISEEARNALEEGAKIIVADAKRRAPKISGKLGASITYKKLNGGNRIKIIAPVKSKKGTPYGQYVEFWPDRQKPFLYPAMDANRETVKEMVVKAIREGVRSR